MMSASSFSLTDHRLLICGPKIEIIIFYNTRKNIILSVISGLRCDVDEIWDTTQHWVVVLYRRFGTTYRAHLQGPRSPRSPWYRGSKSGGCIRLTILPPSCADCLEIPGASTSTSPTGLSRPVHGQLWGQNNRRPKSTGTKLVDAKANHSSSSTAEVTYVWNSPPRSHTSWRLLCCKDFVNPISSEWRFALNWEQH
jgi:hypothetical protein